MNLPFSFQQKLKIAILLFCIMVCTLLIRVLEDKIVKNMGAAFTSIYNDRLVPATDLFQISTHIYEKSQIFALYFHQEHVSDYNSIDVALAKYNFKIDSLLNKYESTFLVTPEKGNLSVLKKLIAANKTIENEIVALPTIDHKDATVATYEHRLTQSYFNIIKNLSRLTKIQSEVGEDLINESQRLMVGSKLFSTLQFVLAIVIGALIVSILFTSNVIKIKTERFDLN